jgi:hypothetical protein
MNLSAGRISAISISSAISKLSSAILSKLGRDFESGALSKSVESAAQAAVNLRSANFSKFGRSAISMLELPLIVHLLQDRSKEDPRWRELAVFLLSQEALAQPYPWSPLAQALE